MSLTLGDNFSYQGAKPLDSRLKYDTLASMIAVADSTMYDGCLAYCVATDKTYQWKSANEVDPTLRKWREFSSGGSAIQVDELPEASSTEEGKIYQYIGATDANYTHGYFYECVSDGESTPTYSWEQKDVQSASNVFPGTLDEWEALTPEEQAKYDFVASPEEDGSEANKFFYQTGIVTINTTVGQTTMENIELPNPMPDNEYCVDVQIIGGFPEACILNAMHTSVNGFRIYAYNTGAADYDQTVRWQVYRIPH